jgi:isoleucyl-tRNA synthetase
MYKKVDRIPDFPALERRHLAFWKQVGAFEQLRAKNAGKQKWSFLDGPITANNPMGVHHAWGRSLKDMYQRYHAMCGHDQRYQNGFDCQGLWVEVEVEKELGFSSKDDIVAYGIDRFVDKCKERVRKYSAVQTDQSIRLGYWMDWDNSYYTMAEENNFTIWSFLKKCHQRGFVYKGFDVMPWCPRCAVGLSQMEMHEGYLQVKDPSVVVKLPIRGREREALLVWTTTPWTLTSNVAAAVHPEMAYYRIRQGDWIYYVGAANWENDRTRDSDGNKTGLRKLPDLLAANGPWENLATIEGAELIGLAYDGPFDELPAQNSAGGHPHTDEALAKLTGASCHQVIAWDQITGSEGTGVVHIAPGCGKEDFELGRQLGLVAIAPLNEHGRYVEGFDWLSGQEASQVAAEIIANLKDKGLLVAREDYPHAYPHCWRCKTPVLFRAVDEWFIKMDWRDEIAAIVRDIRWIPEFGQERELDWLRNMRDWMISKKRYWGLALPIWVCQDPACDHFEIMGSREELKERAVAGWEEFEGHSPHRPWIDGIEIACGKCGGRARRIPDVGNPWLDAGIVPYSTMGYNSDRAYWEQWFPADLVLECFPGQFRNWFYALLSMSTMMENRAPFKTLLGHALVRDEYGAEMHKSLGNAIEFNEAAETIGAEIMRYLFAAQNPVNNLNFPDIHHKKQQAGKRHLDEEIRRKLLTFWNCYSFYIQYAEVDAVRPGQFDLPVAQRARLDRWILSRLQGLVAHARQCFDNYQLHALIGRFEQFVEEDLSNWFLRRSRRRFWKAEADQDKQAAYASLYEVLHTCMRLMAPVLPFLMEEIYQNLVRAADPRAPDSVHLLDYPVVDESLIDLDLEASVGAVIRLKNLGLSLRNQANLKIRQPLAKLVVRPGSPAEEAVLDREELCAVLLEELNVKVLERLTGEPPVTTTLKPNKKALGPKLGKRMGAAVAALESLDPAAVTRAFSAGEPIHLNLDGEVLALEPGDLFLNHQGPEGLAVAIEDQTFVGLSTELTPALVREGLARDFVRQVQSLRKERELDISDRIHLRYLAGEKFQQAVAEWTEYIQAETLALALAVDAGLSDGQAKPIQIAGEKVWLDLERWTG